MLFFLHIPKTAGSTLNYIIKNNFRDKAQEIRWHWTTWIDREELIQKLKKVDLKGKSLIHGHFVFGFHELVNPEETKYLTFVREPLKKVISGFYHIKRDKKSQFHDVYKSKDIVDYLLDQNILENDNGLVRRLSGIGDQVPYGKIEPQHLELAIRNINNYFLAVGITEKFDLSIELFKHLGIISKKYYWKQNEASNKKKEGISIPDETLKAFKELNKHDFQLYAYCLNWFNKETEKIRFSQSEFNFKNRLYNISLIPNKIVKKISNTIRQR